MNSLKLVCLDTQYKACLLRYTICIVTFSSGQKGKGTAEHRYTTVIAQQVQGPLAALVTAFLDQSNRTRKSSEQGNRDNQDNLPPILRISHVGDNSLPCSEASARIQESAKPSVL